MTAFLDKVKIKSKLVRVRCDNGKVEWVSREIQERDGVVIGFRTLSNGLRDHDYEYGWSYLPTEHFQAVMVVFSEREKPVFVELESIVSKT